MGLNKRIYIVRHGETELNHKMIIQGRGINSSINEKGKKQAELFFNAYKNIPFDRVYTSTLQRSRQSVQGFLNIGLPHTKLSGLDEVGFGDYEGKDIKVGDKFTLLYLIHGWENGDYDLKTPNGDSANEIMARQNKALSEIVTHQDETNVLICMHGRALRIFLCNMLGLHLREMRQFEMPNLCLNIVEYNYDSNSFSLELKCDTKHLNGISI